MFWLGAPREGWRPLISLFFKKTFFLDPKSKVFFSKVREVQFFFYFFFRGLQSPTSDKSAPQGTAAFLFISTPTENSEECEDRFLSFFKGQLVDILQYWRSQIMFRYPYRESTALIAQLCLYRTDESCFISFAKYLHCMVMYGIVWYPSLIVLNYLP